MKRHTHTRLNIKSAQYYSFIIFGIRKRGKIGRGRRRRMKNTMREQQVGRKRTRPFVSIPVTFLVFHFDTISCSSEFHFQNCFSSVFFCLIESIYIKKSLDMRLLNFIVICIVLHWFSSPFIIQIGDVLISVYGEYSSGRNRGS